MSAVGGVLRRVLPGGAQSGRQRLRRRQSAFEYVSCGAAGCTPGEEFRGLRVGARGTWYRHLMRIGEHFPGQSWQAETVGSAGRVRGTVLRGQLCAPRGRWCSEGCSCRFQRGDMVHVRSTRRGGYVLRGTAGRRRREVAPSAPEYFPAGQPVHPGWRWCPEGFQCMFLRGHRAHSPGEIAPSVDEYVPRGRRGTGRRRRAQWLQSTFRQPAVVAGGRL